MNKTTPARAALIAQQKKLEKMLAAASTLAQRAESFRHVSAVHTNDCNLESLREHRRTVMADVATGEKPIANLDLIDTELAVAEAKHLAGRREAEIAQAGAARLQAQYDTMAAEIAPVSAAMPALRYAAACEVLRSRLGPYREALLALAAVHAQVVGAALAVDQLADVSASPARLFVSNRMHMAGLGLPLPDMSGIVASDYEVPPDVAAFRAEAALVLESLEW
jgi:hypothetical protein